MDSMEKIDLSHISFCGFDCSKCPYYYKNVKSLPADTGEKNICKGCMSNNEFRHYKDCHIAMCAQNKGISFCGLCPQFPCSLYSNFTTDAINKIYKIKELLITQNVK